jgi:hypothetical protein
MLYELANDIKNKYIRRTLKCIIFLVGLMPYVLLTLISSVIWYMFISQNVIDVFSIERVVFTFTVFGSWFAWIVFCKIVKFTITHIRTFAIS